MSQTATRETTREERRSALDDFAALGLGDPDAGQVPAVVPAPGRDEIHGAIAVAVKRDERQVLSRLKMLAAAAGTDWYYRWPVRNRKKQRIDWVEGPSIKLANDLARIYGNCDVDARLALDLGNHWLFQARIVDLETGFSLARPFQQRKSAGRLRDADADRNLDVAFQIGASKAIRNVVVNALQTFADYAVEEARNALVDRIGEDVGRWRERTLARLADRRVELSRVEAVIGREAAKWQAADIARVIAIMTAVADEMVTLDEVFPPPGEADDAQHRREEGGDAAKAASGALDEFAAGTRKAGGGADDVTASPGSGGGGSPDAATAAAGASIPTPLQDAPAEAGNAANAGASGRPEAPPQAGSGRAEPPAPGVRREAIDKLIAVATDKELSTEEKLEILDNMQPFWMEKLADQPGFVTQLFDNAARVARGELKPAAAKKYLEALK